MNGNKTRLFIRKALRFLSDVINSLDEADKKKIREFFGDNAQAV